jgi:hypothetical protein
VQKNRMTIKEAVDFLEGLINNGTASSVKGWRYAMSGMIDQIRTGEITAGELGKFLALSAARRTYAYRGGLLVRVTGLRNGLPASVSKRTPIAGPSAYLMRDMAAITGTACAAFMLLALEQHGTRSGAFAPEDWADPQAFYKSLERVGVPLAELSLSQ